MFCCQRWSRYKKKKLKEDKKTGVSGGERNCLSFSSSSCLHFLFSLPSSRILSFPFFRCFLLSFSHVIYSFIFSHYPCFSFSRSFIDVPDLACFFLYKALNLSFLFRSSIYSLFSQNSFFTPNIDIF